MYSTLIRRHVGRRATPPIDPSGTCAMGAELDAAAVVDSACRGFGVGGLRVADASVMPDIPSANTNLPTIMVAERMVALL